MQESKMSEILIFDWVLSSTHKEESQNKEGIRLKVCSERVQDAFFWRVQL